MIPNSHILLLEKRFFSNILFSFNKIFFIALIHVIKQVLPELLVPYIPAVFNILKLFFYIH